MNIEKILDDASKLRIAVVGDRIIDRYLIGKVERISPEAPVQIVRLTQTRENEGGAGNVAENLRRLGVQVSTFYGKHVPIKTRVMADNHHLLRIDEEEEPYWMHWDEVDIGLGYGIENNKFDAVVVSDYNKGMCSDDVVSEVIGRCVNNNIPVIVDAKHNLGKYQEASLIKCNEHEWDSFVKYMDYTPEDYSPRQFMINFSVDDVVITHGRNGMSGFNHEMYRVEGHAINISDTCGAGDTATAVLAVMKILQWGLHEAMIVANIAASEVCRYPGVFPINKELLIKRFNEVML